MFSVTSAFPAAPPARIFTMKCGLTIGPSTRSLTSRKTMRRPPKRHRRHPNGMATLERPRDSRQNSSSDGGAHLQDCKDCEHLVPADGGCRAPGGAGFSQFEIELQEERVPDCHARRREALHVRLCSTGHVSE